jgi:hypothetical protein
MAKRCQVKLVDEQASTTTEEKRSEGNEALHKVGGRYTFIDKSVTEPTGQRERVLRKMIHHGTEIKSLHYRVDHGTKKTGSRMFVVDCKRHVPHSRSEGF